MKGGEVERGGKRRVGRRGTGRIVEGNGRGNMEEERRVWMIEIGEKRDVE